MRNHKHVSLFWQSAWVKQEIFCAARSSSSFFHLLICNLKTQSCIRQKSACITSSLVTLILIFIFSLMCKYHYTPFNLIFPPTLSNLRSWNFCSTILVSVYRPAVSSVCTIKWDGASDLKLWFEQLWQHF